jgi:hypothetical protein
MDSMKKFIAIAVLALASCQASDVSTMPTQIFTAPASDAAESLDLTKLPEGFPIIGEIKLPTAPARCALSKANRTVIRDGESYEGRYVFTSQMDEGLYQLGVNGVLRTVKQSGAADMDDKKVRYYKTIDAPEVEIMVVLEQEGNRDESIIGRIKAWDADVPLLCAYNRIEVVGDCDL